MFTNVLAEIKDKVVQEIESVTGVKTEFRKPRLSSGGDSRDVVGTFPNKRQLPRPEKQMSLLSPTFTHGLAHQHILSVDMFTKEQLNELFNLAQTLKSYVVKGRPLDNVLKVSIYLGLFKY